MNLRQLWQKVPKKWQLIAAKILLKLLDYGVFIFVFVLISTFATVIYVELYYGSSMWIVILVSMGIFFTMVFLGWLLPAFGDASYWDAEYVKGGDQEVIEWFGITYLDVRLTIRRIMAPEKLRPILMIGCGNSSFPSDLWDAGYKNVTSIDVSTVVLTQLSKRYARKKELRWMCVDATNMGFDDETFHFAIDKGTLDAILCTNNPDHWIKTYLKELYRVLTPGGSFMLITGYEPKELMKLFAKHPWTVQHSVVKGRDESTAHLYVASKVSDIVIHDDEDTGLVSGLKKRTTTVHPS
jgi:SAM-dependent methyltransferase